MGCTIILPLLTLSITAACCIRANLAISRFRNRSLLCRWPLIEVAIVAALSSAIKYLSAFTRGNTTNLLEVYRSAQCNAALTFPPCWISFSFLSASVCCCQALFSDCSHAPTIDPLDMCNMSFVYATIISLIFTTLVTLLLTTYSIGLPVPSGLLIPSLTTGAAMGRLTGTCMAYRVSQPILHERC